MIITMGFIKGLKIGLEYVELDDEDREAWDLESTLLTTIDLGLIRFTIFSGEVEQEE